MGSQFYVHLSSGDSKQYFPENETSRFIVKLPEILHLKEHWEVALCSIMLPSTKERKLLICSDVCSESIIGEKRLPLLRVLTREFPSSLEPLQYIPVRPQDIERITIYINSSSGSPVSFVGEACECTLHFKHV